jgi:lipoate-protein ligase A
MLAAEEWRVVDSDLVEPVKGVATVEAVSIARSKNVIPNTIIFWRPTTPFVCLGYFQLVREEVFADVCEKKGIKIVRRILGGGTGYVDSKQLLYDVILGSEQIMTPIASNIDRLYKYVLSGVMQGLREMGLKEVQLMPDLNSAIWLNGKKVSGNAATGLSGAQIVGGSLLVDFDFETLSKVFRNPYKNLKPGINSLEEGLTCINRELPKRIELPEVKKAVQTGFERALKIRLENGRFTKRETKLIQELVPKFEKREWTYGMDLKADKLMPYDNIDGA